MSINKLNTLLIQKEDDSLLCIGVARIFSGVHFFPPPKKKLTTYF